MPAFKKRRRPYCLKEKNKDHVKLACDIDLILVYRLLVPFKGICNDVVMEMI